MSENENNDEIFFDCENKINLIDSEDNTPENNMTSCECTIDEFIRSGEGRRFCSSSRADANRLKGFFIKLEAFNPEYDKITKMNMPLPNHTPTKYCAKCKTEYEYPSAYYKHCLKKNSTTDEFRCCDNLNIDADKLDKKNLILYCKYLKKQNSKALLDIHQFYEDKVNKIVSDEVNKFRNYKSHTDLRINTIKETSQNKTAFINDNLKGKTATIENLDKSLLQWKEKYLCLYEDLDMLLKKHTEQQTQIDNLKMQNEFYKLQNEALIKTFKVHQDFTSGFEKEMGCLDTHLTEVKIEMDKKLKVRHQRHNEKKLNHASEKPVEPEKKPVPEVKPEPEKKPVPEKKPERKRTKIIKTKKKVKDEPYPADQMLTRSIKKDLDLDIEISKRQKEKARLEQEQYEVALKAEEEKEKAEEREYQDKINQGKLELLMEVSEKKNIPFIDLVLEEMPKEYLEVMVYDEDGNCTEESKEKFLNYC